MRKKFNENKKISTSKRREIKCRDNSPLPARYQSKHKRYFYLFVCLGVFISAIKLPRIPNYLLELKQHPVIYSVAVLYQHTIIFLPRDTVVVKKFNLSFSFCFIYFFIESARLKLPFLNVEIQTR